MSFPMRIIKESARCPYSRGGGKDYHLVLIVATDDKAMLIRRYSKKGQWGSMFTQVGSISQMQTVFDGIFKEKMRGEYKEMIQSTKKDVNNEREFKEALGAQYWAKIAPNELKFLSDEIDVTDCKAEKPVRWVKKEDGKFERVEEHLLVEEAPEPVEARVDENPTWGMF